MDEDEVKKNLVWRMMTTLKEYAKNQKGIKGRVGRQEGLEFEKQIEEYLLSLGYSVEIAMPIKRLMVSKGRQFWRNIKVDFFGCLDLMAIHPKKEYFLPIQATIARGSLAQKKKDMEKVGWNLKASCPQIWIKGFGPKEKIIPPSFGVPVSIFTKTPAGWIETNHYLKYGVWIFCL